MKRQLTAFSKRLFLKMAARVQGGSLELVCPERSYRFGPTGGDLDATVAVHNGRFFSRLVFGGDVGAGESYVDGDWSSPDPVAVVRLAVRNLRMLEGSNRPLSAISRLLDLRRHRSRSSTPRGSRRNIRAHYDLNNEFFRLFLDSNMIYSCAYFQGAADTLEVAQIQKLDRICRKLQLRPGDHLLEIGTGWGAFAIYAAQNYGCRVTTTTISREQHDFAARWFARNRSAGDRIELLFEDYRNLKGRFDKIVSVEMFEAVGLRFYDDFFAACDRLLKPEGSMLLQTITIVDQKFPVYRRQADWIQKHIFPGSELASVSRILQSLARVTQLSLFHFEDIGSHYAKTIQEWRSRFRAALPRVRALGFDDRFIRIWDYYLAYCDAAFQERHISDAQMLFTRNYSRRILFGEPWEEMLPESSRQLPSPADLRRSALQAEAPDNFARPPLD